MKTKLFLMMLALSIPVASVRTQESPEASPSAPASSGSTKETFELKSAEPEKQAPLEAVVAEVKKALEIYQNSLGNGPNALPPLDSAEFDFKTSVATGRGGSINLFIFQFGVSKEDTVVNDVTYTYSVPPPPKSPVAEKAKQSELLKELVDTMKAAAAAVKTSGTIGKLKFNKLVINVQYGVKWEVKGGVQGSYSFVTIGINAGVNKNTVQSVKLTFQEPKKP